MFVHITEIISNIEKLNLTKQQLLVLSIMLSIYFIVFI